MTVRLLAVDPSYQLGAVILDLTDSGRGVELVADTFVRTLSEKLSWREAPKRVGAYLDALQSLINTHHPSWLVYEAPTGQTTHDAVRCFGRMEGMLVTLARLSGLHLLLVTPNEVKNAALDWQKLPQLPKYIIVQSKKRGTLTYAAHLFPGILERHRNRDAREAVADAICVGIAGARGIAFGLEN